MEAYGFTQHPSKNVQYNARHQPPRIQPRNHPSLAHESNAIRGRLHGVVRRGVFQVVHGYVSQYLYSEVLGSIYD